MGDFTAVSKELLTIYHREDSQSARGERSVHLILINRVFSWRSVNLHYLI